MVQENIDILHRVVIEAKDRKAKGNIGKDVWQEDLEPRAAVCGRTVPILEQEAKRLRESLAAMEEENMHLQAQIEENTKATEDANGQALELLDKFDAVYEEWQKLPTDGIEEWTVQSAESLKPMLLS